MLSTYESLIQPAEETANILEELGRKHLAFLASKKTCRVCGEEKARSDFCAHSHSHDGRDSRCRDCTNRQRRLRAAWKREHPSPPNGSECPLCQKPTSKWVLDHCHLTDDMRGYICDRCNTSLGGFDDNVAFLQRAIEWVRGGGRTDSPSSPSSIPPVSLPRHLL
jgi:hypothetical protein